MTPTTCYKQKYRVVICCPWFQEPEKKVPRKHRYHCTEEPPLLTLVPCFEIRPPIYLLDDSGIWSCVRSLATQKIEGLLEAPAVPEHQVRTSAGYTSARAAKRVHKNAVPLLERLVDEIGDLSRAYSIYEYEVTMSKGVSLGKLRRVHMWYYFQKRIADDGELSQLGRIPMCRVTDETGCAHTYRIVRCAYKTTKKRPLLRTYNTFWTEI